jgi:DNA-binding transcriptional regulator YiaG
MPHRAQIRHDGCLHTVEVPHLTVPRCQKCGELLFDNGAHDQVSQALRAQLHLLTPEQIRSNRSALGLSPQELSIRLGMPLETIGQLEDSLLIQSRALDNLLRVFFAVPQARSALGEAAHNPDFGVVVSTGC